MSFTRADEQILYEARSAFQDIVLAREPTGHLNLTLDDVWQFRSQDEHVFHEVLADTPMLFAVDPRRVLILGGGDGLALRNVLRYPSVEAVTLCELDPAVLEMTASVAEMRALTEGALADPRVELVAADARAFLDRPLPIYDVIICDFPAATSPELAPLFGASFFAKLGPIVHRDSVISVQVSQDPAGFWLVCDAVETQFTWLHPMLVNLDLDGSEGHDWADFIIASQAPQQTRREVAAAARFLSRERVASLRIQNRNGVAFETRAYGRV